MANKPIHLSGSETIGATGERGRMTLFRAARPGARGATAPAPLGTGGVVVIPVFVTPPAPKAPAATAVPGAPPAR
jgi:hypothetical protein